MNACIFFFSGTGNSAAAANYFKNYFKRSEIFVNLISVENKNHNLFENILRNSVIAGLIFPIHSSYPPVPIQNFLKKHQNNFKNKKLFTVITCGYVAGDAANYTVKKYLPENCNHFYNLNLKMGNNLHLPLLSPLKVTSAAKMQNRLIKIEKTIENSTNNIVNDKYYIMGNNPAGKLLGLIQRSIATNFEKTQSNKFSADSTCVKCGWCVQNCPVNNIELKNGKIVFKGNCILCMRCYNFCPTESIQFMNKTFNKEKYKRYSGPFGKKNKTYFK